MLPLVILDCNTKHRYVFFKKDHVFKIYKVSFHRARIFKQFSIVNKVCFLFSDVNKHYTMFRCDV